MKIFFEHEKLKVYQLALEFSAWAAELPEELAPESGPAHNEIFSGLERISLDMLLNIAESPAKRNIKERALSLEEARDASLHCAALLDALAARQFCTKEHLDSGKNILKQIESKLSSTVNHYVPESVVYDPPSEYKAENEKNE